MSLSRCPRRGTPHAPHPCRLYFAGMGAVVPTTCPGEGFGDLLPGEHEVLSAVLQGIDERLGDAP